MCAVKVAACRSAFVHGTTVQTEIQTNKMTMFILVAIDTNYKEEKYSNNYDDSNDDDDNNNDPQRMCGFPSSNFQGINQNRRPLSAVPLHRMPRKSDNK